VKLTTLHVGVPVFWLQASVEHSVVRKPTVFERMIMRLSRRGVENSAVGSATLRTAFEDHLGAKGIPRLLESSANELLRLGIVQRADSSTSTSILDQPIRTLTLSPAGQEFYNRNSLPSLPTRDAVELFYLPWSNSLVSERPSRLAASPPALAFDVRELAPRDPSSLVRATLKEQPPRFLRGESRLISIEADVDDTVDWLTLDVDLVVTPEGYLELHVAGNKAATDWLARLEPTIVQATLLKTVVSGEAPSHVVFPSDVMRSLTRLELIAPALGARSAEVHLPNLRTQVRLGVDYAMPSWLPDEDAARVVGSPLPATVPDGVTSVTMDGGRATSAQQTGALALTWAGRRVFALVRADLDAQAAGALWNAFGEDLAADLTRSPDVGIFALPLAWASRRPVQALDDGGNARTLDEVLGRLREFVMAAREVAPNALADQAPAFLGVAARLTALAGTHDSLDIGTLSGWAKTMGSALGESARLDTVLSPLLGRVNEPSTVAEMREVIQLGRLAGSLPAQLFSAPVRVALLADLWRDPSGGVGDSVPDVLQPIARFAVAQAELDAVLGRRNAVLANGGGALASAGSTGAALQVAERWLHAVDDPELARSVDEHMPDGLVALRADVLKWRASAAASMAASLPPGQDALVFDSNSLLDDPECLRQLGSGRVGVIPNRVLQELDGLKRNTNEDTARRARAAHRTVDEVRQLGMLRFEVARSALIPSDLGSVDDPDNQILSVAIAYSGGNVILVTKDNNLRAKAQATGVSARSWPEIREARGERP
jgi:rRNA-processing protein FCF1